MSKITILIFAICIFVNSFLGAQTTLGVGDIAFIGINSDGNEDDFSFLLLQNIEANTSINFTDNGWTTSNTFNSIYPESHFEWISDASMKAGEIIHIKTYNGTALATANFGSITGEKMTISVAGDQILAYQGTKENPTFIAAISFNKNDLLAPENNFDSDSYSNSTSALPEELKIGYSAVHIVNKSNYSESDNSIYNGSTTTGTKSVLLEEINNYLNWNTSNTTAFSQYPLSYEFTVDLSTDIEHQTYSVDFFPNPASNYIYISSKNPNHVLIKIIDQQGTTVKELSINPGQKTTINIENLKPGIYLINAFSKTENFIHKIVIQ